MATTQTQIADLVSNPLELASIVQAKFRVYNTLTTSGVATTGPEVDQLMAGGSNLAKLIYVNKVDTTQFNHSNDDFDDKGPVGKLNTSPYLAHRFDLNWGWAYTDLVRMITKYDVRAGLAGAIPVFWAEVAENIAVASLKGAIGTDPALTVGDGTGAFDLNMIIDAASSLDDPRSARNLFVSNKTFAKLQKSNRSTFVPTADTNISFKSYAGYNIFVTNAFGDDTTVVAEDGCLAFATGVIPGTIPAEIKRDADAGHGGGGEILRTRLSMVAAPQGVSYNLTAPAKPSLADLANHANWTLEAPVKRVGFRAIKHTI